MSKPNIPFFEDLLTRLSALSPTSPGLLFFEILIGSIGWMIWR